MSKRTEPITSPFDKTQNNVSPGTAYVTWPTPRTAVAIPSATTPDIPLSATTPQVPPSATTPMVPASATTPQVPLTSTPHTARVASTGTALMVTPPTALSYHTPMHTAMNHTPFSKAMTSPFTIHEGVTPMTLQSTQPTTTQQTTPLECTQAKSREEESSKAADYDEEQLVLSQEHIEIIKNDFITRRKMEGKMMSPQDVKAFTVVEDYRKHLHKNIKECGQHLDYMLGKRFIYVMDALKTLEQVVALGVITAEEAVLSRDIEKLHAANGNDVVTIHSLSNIVRKVLNNRQAKMR